MNTDALRAALLEQEKFAPTEHAVLTDLTARTPPNRRAQNWATGLLTAAAVVGIAITVTTLATPPATTPARTTTTSTHTPSSTTAPSPSEMRNQPPQQSVNPSDASRQAEVERQVQQAAASAETDASSAQAAASAAAATCQAAAASHALAASAINASTVDTVTRACAQAYGARAGYTAEWVQTTLGKLQILTTGHPSTAAIPIVVIQVHALFGTSQRTETMLIRLFPGSTQTPGVDIPANPVNLAALTTTVHRL